MEAIAGFMKNAPDYLIALSGIITSLTVFCALTPTTLDDKYLGKATKFINMLLKLANIGAGNVLASKNKDEKGRP